MVSMLYEWTAYRKGPEEMRLRDSLCIYLPVEFNFISKDIGMFKARVGTCLGRKVTLARILLEQEEFP